MQDLIGIAGYQEQEEALLERESATRVPVVVRVYAGSGRFMTRPEKLALGDFLLQAMRNREIRIRATHPVTRSYVSTETLMELSWRVLGQPGKQQGIRRVDACTHTYSLEELARLVASETGATAHLRLIRPGSYTDRYAGDTAAFQTLLEQEHLKPHPMSQQIRLTLGGLRHQNLPCPK